MTNNKLPEIGQRYKSVNIIRPHTITLVGMYTKRNGDQRVILLFDEDEDTMDLSIRTLNNYEELLDQEPINPNNLSWGDAVEIDIDEIQTAEEQWNAEGDQTIISIDEGIEDMTCEATVIKDKDGNFEVQDLKYSEPARASNPVEAQKEGDLSDKVKEALEEVKYMLSKYKDTRSGHEILYYTQNLVNAIEDILGCRLLNI